MQHWLCDCSLSMNQRQRPCLAGLFCKAGWGFLIFGWMNGSSEQFCCFSYSAVPWGRDWRPWLTMWPWDRRSIKSGCNGSRRWPKGFLRDSCFGSVGGHARCDVASAGPLWQEMIVKTAKSRAMSGDLKHEAARVRENAYAPYSNFQVGAAIRAASGSVYVGCNVENVAYPEGTCAEAGAIAAMIAAGEKSLVEAYVIAGSPMPVSPCGGCRQKLAEFGAGDVVVTMATTGGVEQQTTLAELLPGAFGAAHMDGS